MTKCRVFKLLSFVSLLKMSVRSLSLLGGKKDDMDVMSTAPEGSMHKPLASCMWIFWKRLTFYILLKSNNALLMHCGVNRLKTMWLVQMEDGLLK